MKHVKLFGELINESIDGGSYYFSKYQVDVAGTPAKGETKYAVVSDNAIDFEGTTMYLKSSMNSLLASLEIEILSIYDTEDEAAAAYATAVKSKVGAQPHHISFAYGTIEVKGSNLPFNQIQGTRAKLSR